MNCNKIEIITICRKNDSCFGKTAPSYEKLQAKNYVLKFDIKLSVKNLH